MNTITYDDVKIVINQTDTKPEGSDNFITLKRLGTEKFVLDNKGNVLNSNTGALLTKTVKKTIGGIGITADFNFVTAANITEQPIDLGAIVPARARVVDVYLVTDAAFTGATTLVADVGNVSGGAEFIASATIFDTNAVLALANAGACPVAPNVAASKVWVNATPGANWSLVTAGKVSVYVTYIDVTNI